MAEIIILLLLRLSFYFGLYFQRPIIFRSAFSFSFLGRMSFLFRSIFAEAAKNKRRLSFNILVSAIYFYFRPILFLSASFCLVEN